MTACTHFFFLESRGGARKVTGGGYDKTLILESWYACIVVSFVQSNPHPFVSFERAPCNGSGADM